MRHYSCTKSRTYLHVIGIAAVTWIDINPGLRTCRAMYDQSALERAGKLFLEAMEMSAVESQSDFPPKAPDSTEIFVPTL